MKNYLTYLWQKPTKLFLPIAVTAFAVTLSVLIFNESNVLWHRLTALLCSGLLIALINLQIFGEYKMIEGFWNTVKYLFRKK